MEKWKNRGMGPFLLSLLACYDLIGDLTFLVSFGDLPWRATIQRRMYGSSGYQCTPFNNTNPPAAYCHPYENEPSPIAPHWSKWHNAMNGLSHHRFPMGEFYGRDCNAKDVTETMDNLNPLGKALLTCMRHPTTCGNCQDACFELNSTHLFFYKKTKKNKTMCICPCL